MTITALLVLQLECYWQLMGSGATIRSSKCLVVDAEVVARQ